MILVLAAATVLEGGCQPKTATVERPLKATREADAVRGLEADRVIEVHDRDLANLVASYAPAATRYVDGRLVRGRPAIKEDWAEILKDPAFKAEWAAERIVVGKGGDVAWAFGRTIVTRTDPVTHQPRKREGVFLNTYAKTVDARWLIVSEFTGDVVPDKE